MKELAFNKTSNIFINSGIIALHWYLENRRQELGHEYSYDLTPDSLSIQSEELLTLLEDAYYLMGKEVYDTSGKKARGKVEKYYFTRGEKPVPFFKMKTYGLGELITNDPTPTAGKNGQLLKFEKLAKDDQEFAHEIASFYDQKGMKIKGYLWKDQQLVKSPAQKGDSNIFINDKYTKTTKLIIDKSYLEPGEHACYLTSEKYKKLLDIQNTSPFFSGLLSFASFQSGQSHKIGWKAMYLSRFSPKLCLYTYVSGLDTIVGYFFNSDNLLNLNKLYRRNSAFFKDENQLIEDNYLSNINLQGFKVRKDNEDKKSAIRDFTEQPEILFMLILEFYRQFLFEQNLKVDEDDSFLLFGQELRKTPVSLISFRADKFASTLRPNAYEEFNNFKFTVSLIHYFQKNGIDFSQLMGSLKIIKPAERNVQNSYRLERQTRAKVLDLILHQKPVIGKITQLMYECYTYLLSNEPIGFKRFDQISLLVKLYEPTINFGGNKTMNKVIQEKAINLGTSIGQGILRFSEDGENNDQAKNARNGRRYIIGLYKARTLDQFNDAIIRIMNKYKIQFSKELLTSIEPSNFEYIKQFAIISALNQINSALNRSNNESK
jgi:hypothetical protein